MTEYSEKPKVGEAKRGGALSAWLIFLMVVNAGTALYYLFSAGAVLDGLQAMTGNRPPAFLVYALAVGALINVGAAVLLWQMRKLGFYIFAGMAVVVILLNLSLGLGLASSVAGLIGVGILWLFVRGRWEYMS